MSDFETLTPVRKTNDGEISLWEIMAVLVRRRGTVVVFTLFVSALAAVYALAFPGMNFKVCLLKYIVFTGQ